MWCGTRSVNCLHSGEQRLGGKGAVMTYSLPSSEWLYALWEWMCQIHGQLSLTANERYFMKGIEDKQTKCLLCKVFKETFILTASIIPLSFSCRVVLRGKFPY